MQSIARANEVIGRSDIACRIGDNEAPTIAARSQLHRPHQAQLESVTPMRLQHADAADISSETNMRRWQHACECNCRPFVTGEPPMPGAKAGNGGAAKEGQPVQIGQDIRNLVILTVDLANPISRFHGFKQRLARSISRSEKPRARAHASAAASPYSITARFTIRQEIPSAGDDASRLVNNNMR